MTTQDQIKAYLDAGNKITICKMGDTAIDPTSGLSHRRLRDRDVYLREMGLQAEAQEDAHPQ